MAGRKAVRVRQPARGGPRSAGGRDEALQAALARAEGRLREAGFDVGDGVDAVVDPRLPIMGYTMRGEGGRFRITVSAGAMRSGMLEGLLSHELSHIVRMRTGHPSHDPRIIEAVTSEVADGVATKDYQRKILHDLVNNVEDLYADDIAFKVIREGRFWTPEQASAFLQDWVADAPAESRDPERARWETAWLLANNARAIAQMARHGVEDIGGRAAAANERLLSRMPPAARERFERIRGLLATLPEGLTGDGYRTLLRDYLSTFLGILAPA